MIATARTLAAWVAARAGMRGERGATAVEYGIIVSLIAAAVVTTVFLLGQASGGQFDCTAESWNTKTSACP